MNKITLLILVFSLFVFGGCSKNLSHSLSDIESNDNKINNDKVSDQNIDSIAFEYFINGMMYEDTKEYKKAADLYSLALNYHPESFEIRYSLASVNYKLGKYPLVINTLRDINPVDEDVLLLRAASYMSMGLSNESVDTYLELLQLYPDNLTAYINLSGYYRRTRNLDSLLWIYENLTRLRPQISSNWREMGTLLGMKGNYQEAKDSFQKSLSIDNGENNIVSFISLAEIYSLLKENDSALIMYKQILEIDSSNIIANNELSLLYVRAGEFEEALPYAKRLAEFKPSNFDAGRRLALIYYGLDSLTVSDSIFTSLVNAGDSNFLNHYYLGLISIHRKEYQIARDEFEIVTKMEDTLVTSWLDLGVTYKKLNDIDNEIKTYENGLKSVKDQESILKLLLALGSAYDNKGDYYRAVEIFKDIIDKDPENAQALNYLGYLWADKGENLAEAKKLIERALNIEPENAAFLDSYGWVYYKQGNFVEALKYLKKAGESSTDYIIYDHLGDAYNALGDIVNARLWWNKAVEINPENKLIKEKLNR